MEENINECDEHIIRSLNQEMYLQKIKKNYSFSIFNLMINENKKIMQKVYHRIYTIKLL